MEKKKLKKLVLKKETFYNLSEEEQKSIHGGQTMTIATDPFRCPSINNCPTNIAYDTCQCPGPPPGTDPYCGTLKNCGTGAVYCITEGCFFETNEFICGEY
ncbi:class I lanthipeptide [uncultured Bacteroides sp.]|jgi:hypothetical protein|uniref:class I lanthipeptide n=1 Tax=uncultured Bacteroides sp. TaxID=162156 RepID=UPI0025866D46|nr:class I lanthipeptide [uncultured Bacteroides sp.]